MCLADETALPQQISTGLIRWPITLFQQVIDVDLVVNDRKDDRHDRYRNAPSERPSDDLDQGDDQAPFPIAAEQSREESEEKVVQDQPILTSLT